MVDTAACVTLVLVLMLAKTVVAKLTAYGKFVFPVRSPRVKPAREQRLLLFGGTC